MIDFVKKTLIEGWTSISLKSYTVYGLYVIIFCLAAPEILYYGFAIDTNPVVWGRIILLAALLTLVGRLIKQPTAHRIRRRIIVGFIVLVTLAMALPALADEHKTEDLFEGIAFELIAKWEGRENNSYQDIVGVWTICYGHTATAGPKQYKTNDQCKQLLVEEIAHYRKGLHAYFNPTTLSTRLTDPRDAAYTSLAYNVGIRGAGRSTATRRINKGQIIAGCNALTWWNKAGGRVIRGLVRRRTEEQMYCLQGTAS